jgi:hypothetical protein
MNLISALKDVGKGLEDAGKWLDDAVKFAEPIVGELDPPLMPVLQEIDQLLGLVDGSKTSAPMLSQAALQALLQGTMISQAIKAKANEVTIA